MRSEFVRLLDNLSTARKKDYPSTSEGSVIDLSTPTKPTTEGAIDLLTPREPTTEGAIDLLTPRKPTTEGAIDLLTPRKPTMQGAMLSIEDYPKDDELEENWSQLQDKTKKHTNAEKRELMGKLIERLYFHHSSWKVMICGTCHKHSSFSPETYYRVPDIGTLPWNLLLRTPKDVCDLEDLRNIFKSNLRAMDSLFKTNLCHWPEDFVQSAMMLVFHAFHCPDVHVFFIPSYMAEKEKVEQDDQKLLDPKITTLLFMLWKENHYAVIRVDISSKRVTLWDAAWDPKLDTVKHMIHYWRKHINYALASHLPNQVMENRGNIVSMEDASVNNAPLWEKEKMHYPLWKINFAMPEYLQRDGYTCGAIALNQFAYQIMMHDPKQAPYEFLMTDEHSTELIKCSIESPDTLKEKMG
jgi:hypothetical protein